MKIFTWNVNGIRSIFKTTFRDWLQSNDPDIVCLQEIKADSEELAEEFSQIDGYYAYFNSSSLKKGHSGTAVYTKIKPVLVETKLGIERFDDEGRCLKLIFKDFILFNFYIPNGSRDKHDMPYKLEVYKKLFPVFRSLANKNTILAGDFNIAHTELDVYHAKQNQNNTMFTPEEREQITKLLSLGYVDAFRYKYPEKKSYTWWPYMNNLRARDIGWRIDYFFVAKPLEPLIKDAFTQREVLGSDHGPCGIALNKSAEIAERPTYAKIKSPAELF
ncbi:MAG: exodeoxyribonuclease III [Minisyncoccia bacterium]|jgi:exodeoxyribonuclease-3